MVMVRPKAELGSLRFSRFEKERLLLALLFSLFAHLAIWGGYEVGKKTGLWKKLHWPAHPPAHLVAAKPVVQPVDPTVFLDVAEAAAEAPKEAKYYSDKNSRAANPDAEIDSNVPKLTGTQSEVPKTETTSRPVKAEPATPTPPPTPVKAKPAEAKPASTLNPGTLHPGNPDESTKQDQEQKPTPKERPRTLREARAASQLPGPAMQQEGGVKRHALRSSLDAIATPFGAYDRAIIEAIQQRWYDLLDSQQYAQDRTGKVTIYFRLNSDGTVTESKIASNTVGDVLGYICLESIEQSAPFGKWPPDMRRMIGANFREITFSFYYY